jgi:hypothetical protein
MALKIAKKIESIRLETKKNILNTRVQTQQTITNMQRETLRKKMELQKKLALIRMEMTSELLKAETEGNMNNFNSPNSFSQQIGQKLFLSLHNLFCVQLSLNTLLH